MLPLKTSEAGMASEVFFGLMQKALGLTWKLLGLTRKFLWFNGEVSLV